MPAAKRSAPVQAESTGTRRRSGRLSSTQLKSVYFESEDESEEQIAGRKKRATVSKKRGRKALNESDEEEEDFKEDSEEEAEVQPKKISRGRPTKKAKEESDEDQYHTPNEDEDNKDNDEDEDDDDDDDDDGPRKVTIIPLEKLRDTGGVPYEDHYVHKNTMLFLKDLKANNKRSWLKCEQANYHCLLISSSLLIGHSMQHTMESTGEH